MENNQRNSGGKLSLMDIQAEQEREQRRPSNNNNQGRRASGGPRSSYNSGGGGSGYGGYQNRSNGGGGRRGSQNRRGSDRSGLPLERGCICSLKEKFGFIHCADRPAEIFFHYSEVSNVHPDHLQLDDEVEFRVGKSRDNPDKLAALEVNQIPTGTIEWEFEESPGERFQGIVDRPLMRSGSNNGMMRRNSDNDNNSNVEGLIRLLVPASEANATEGPKEGEEECAEDGNDDKKAEKMVPEGPKIRFTSNDYNPDGGGSESAGEGKPNLSRKNSSSSSTGQLYRRDLVEFTLVIEKRTRQKFARNIILLQSERERARLAKEEQLLANATLERGVVVSLKQDFGFMRSNARRDEVYFHYSQVHLPEEGGERDATSKENDEDCELKIGQEMEFLVVTEEVEDRNSSNNVGRGKQKTSARKIKFLPKGSVEFSKTIATGVTGRVTIVPRADAGGRNAQRERDPQSLGSIRLTKNITTQDPTNKDPNAEPVNVKAVMLHVGDAPGGLFSCARGSAMGLWIREGDTLLFDITYDFVDRSYYATPTKQLVPIGTGLATTVPAVGDEKENAADNKKEGVDVAATDKEARAGGNDKSSKGKQQKEKPSSNGPAVRLIGLCLAGRAEGTVHTVKEAYGFVHFAERPVDVHFKQFELLPEAVQEDLRRNMGLTMTLNTKAEMMGFHNLSVGTEVQFDLSVQGTVMTQNQNQHRGGNRRGGAQSNQHERENLKAQRILILPKGTILQNKTIGLGIRGAITKEDYNQPYAGILDLENEYQQLTWAERHPLVLKMIADFLSDEAADSLVFHDIQSLKEEEVIAEIIELKAKSTLELTHIPHAGDPRYQGRICLRKVVRDKGDAAAPEQASPLASVETNDEKQQEAEKEEAPPEGASRSKSPKGGRSRSPKGRTNKKKKALQQKIQPIKTIRYDKSSLAQKAKTDVPPGVGDTIVCDIHQNRRTGKVHLESLSVVERRVMGADEVATMEGTAGVGVVKEVVLASKFGFISVLDETASKRELLFFHFASVVNQQRQTQNENLHGRNKKASDAVIHKGDEVKFKIGTEKNGKRVAVDVEVVSAGVGVPSKVDKNACRGYILVCSTDTKVGSSLKQSRSFTRSRDAPAPPKSGGRWDNTKEDNQKDKLREKGEGVILLLEDPTNMFASVVQKLAGGKKEEESEVETPKPTGDADGLGKLHLHYQNGAIALHGAGAPTTMDSSTNPRRGDLVSFVKSRNNANGVKDIRVVTRSVATLVRGHLEHIDHLKGTATFVGSVGDEKKEYNVSLKEVVSCDLSQLKNRAEVEGVLHDDAIHGLCRITDLKLETKLGTGRKERPKLNLNVKKNRAGTIMAQSMMAKGPDGTIGFAPGWTTRVSQYRYAEGDAEGDTPPSA